MITKHHAVTALSLLTSLLCVQTVAAQRQSERVDLQRNGVFVLGNDADVNTVIAYELRAGALTQAGTFATGGRGGAGGNQGGLALAQEQRSLLAVNAGSDSLTSFGVERGFLDLRDVVSAHGVSPVSLATCTKAGSTSAYAYVLNAGSRSIAGFSLDGDGHLEFLPGSVQALSDSSSSGAQIAFDNTCSMVVVIERNPDYFMLYDLDDQGVADPGVQVASLSAGQLGSAVTTNNQLLVSETGTSAASSFQLDPEALDIIPVSQTVENGQAGSCWAVATERSFRCEGGGRQCTVGYIMNAGTSNITSYTIDHLGVLSLREVVAEETFGGAFDGALADRDRYLVVQSRVSPEQRALNLYRIAADGHLELAQIIDDLPASANSVAAAR